MSSKTKVLYISSWHSVLEYDDLTLLSEMGFDWFSTGHYKVPSKLNKFGLRSPIEKKVDKDLLEEFNRDNNLDADKCDNLSTLVSAPINITKSFADKFDIVIVNNWFRNLKDINNYKDKLTIWRTYGNQSPNDELSAKVLVNKYNLKIARMFDFEVQVQNGNKEDGFLRNYVDSTIYNNWDGGVNNLLTFQNQLSARINIRSGPGQHMFPEYIMYLGVHRNGHCELYGLENGVSYCKGCVSWEEQKELYQTRRAYLALPAKPAPYTYNFLEALMTGTPTISFNKVTKDYKHPWYGQSYDIEKIITHGENGLLIENEKEATDCFNQLVKNYSLAESISKAGRQTAKELFDKPIVLKEWKEFFCNVGIFGVR